MGAAKAAELPEVGAAKAAERSEIGDTEGPERPEIAAPEPSGPSRDESSLPLRGSNVQSRISPPSKCVQISSESTTCQALRCPGSIRNQIPVSAARGGRPSRGSTVRGERKSSANQAPSGCR